MSLTYDDAVAFLTAGLTAKGYSIANPMQTEVPRSMPLFHPGPVSAQQLQQLDPGTIVFVDVGGGPGLDVEQLFDGVFISVRVLGKQFDYNSAERLALDIDSLILALAGNGMIGTTKVLYCTRTGGRPQLIDFDKAERSHFQCSYIAKAQTTGLVI